ncbi:FAD:protein FMN transferase [Mangrovibacterium diazotrophicum]|uniref:FAD:protein FMN transferase n=1 Tax=Mangrovibacterium diazotrophicum TaxID=1261403 RepID=A0A419VUZ6_9BACT|nr:FAD:protein FMN transferase [Mangrovibacterium diazotrophicum]RKD85980.1 thiamine biosynthesis lipoprotein [Mangrovibacterium diazotrophicum]
MKSNIKILFFLFCVTLASCSKKVDYIHNEGQIFGTTYHITYLNPKGEDLHDGIKQTMDELNQSLSTYDPNSVISKVNSNQPVELDSFFTTVFKKAEKVSAITDGAFDITVAPMVNVWGFGFKNKENVTTELVDSLKQLVGYEKVKLVDGQIVKQHPGTMLDCSAIAKGYGVDVVAAYIRNQGCKNYMVEIGGEVDAFGVNPKGKPWSIGISKPDEDSFFKEQQLQAIVNLKDKALATSGNYRNFYVEGGKKYAHTIDPHTGYPVQHSLLSTTVLADSCMTADAFATAFMVLGLEKSIEIANAVPDIEVYFIYGDEEGNYKSYFSDGFKSLIQEDYTQK